MVVFADWSKAIVLLLVLPSLPFLFLFFDLWYLIVSIPDLCALTYSVYDVGLFTFGNVFI